MPLLQTKLYSPPARESLVPRSRLIQKLNAGLDAESGGFRRKLSLIAAPAGFGKTTLATAWIAQQAASVAWLSLDEDDREPKQFFHYLALAIEKINGVGQSLALLLILLQKGSLTTGTHTRWHTSAGMADILLAAPGAQQQPQPEKAIE